MTYLQKLKQQTPEAAYWMGFLIADGYFSGKRIKLTLAEKDADHLRRFVQFLGHPREIILSQGKAEFTLQEPDNVAELMQIFDINKNKTYEAPEGIPYTDRDALVCFLIGFIDGDGTITYQSGRETVCLRTVSHIRWRPYIQELSDRTRFGKVTVRSDGYIQLASHRHNDIVKLKQYAQSKSLPILSRKWDRVNEGLTVRGGMRYAVLDMIDAGNSNKEIFERIGCSPAYVSTLRKERRAGGLG